MSNRKLLFIIIVSKQRSYFSLNNQLSYIWYHKLHKRIYNVAYSMYVSSLANVVKAYLILQIIFLPIPARYNNTLLPRNIQSEDIFNLQFTPMKWRNNITRIMWNYTFNAYVESSDTVVTYLPALVITIWTYLQQSGISTYIHTISHR